MDEATDERLPESIAVREVYVPVHQPGFRTKSLVVVTTWTDVEEYTQDDMSELYHQRWRVELDIRAIKVTVGMDVRRCQSVAMVHREIWTCRLADHLIRQTLLEAALQSERSPRPRSFTAALQKIAAAWAVLSACEDALRAQLIDVPLSAIANNLVGERPDRVEPRAIQRRPKPHKLLTEPRADARAKLVSGAAA